jgi:cytochrome P460
MFTPFAGQIRTKAFFLGAVILACSLYLSAQSGDEVQYPKGYRDWTHIKSNLIGPKHPLYKNIGGFQHIYANDKGMQGYRTGSFPEGAILIYDFLEGIEDSSGATKEGPRRFTSVMVRDSKRYASTGGWGFEEFRGDSETDRMIGQAAATAKCFDCHQKVKDNNFVFSAYRK